MTAPPDPRLDPDIRRFVTQLAEDYARHPPFDSVGIEEQRRIAASVRAPWAEGGPVMARTREIVVPCATRPVRVRLHYPVLAPDLPALVYAHGGGWALFGLDSHDRLMREYAMRAGVVVVGVDYALSPEVRFPVALDQMVAVVEWLRAEGRVLGIDPERLAVGGDSAGGNLTLCTCMRLRDAGQARAVKAMVINYGALDIDITTPSHKAFGDGGYLLASDEMLGFWDKYLRSPADAANPYACPARGDFAALPPTYMAVAELDILHDENIAVAAKLREAGVPVQCTVYPGTVHGFIEAVAVARVTATALDDTARWLRERLVATGPSC